MCFLKIKLYFVRFIFILCFILRIFWNKFSFVLYFFFYGLVFLVMNVVFVNELLGVIIGNKRKI